MKEKIKFIQISDTHLFGMVEGKLNGSNSYINLKQVLSSISFNDIDFIVVSGDLSQDCTPDSYKHLITLLEETKTKYYLMPGNHDDVDVLNKSLNINWIKDESDYSFEYSDWFFYMLDTSKHPEEFGVLSPDQLLNLQNALLENKSKLTVIFMHHHPVKIGSRWMDEMMLNQKEEFINIIKSNPQIKAVLYGHIHQSFQKEIDGVLYASAPSTCFQVKENTFNFAFGTNNPGYRVIELDGEVVSSNVVWLKELNKSTS